MGFLTDLVNEGLYGACSNVYWDNHYKEFCRSSGLPYLPVKTGKNTYSSCSYDFEDMEDEEDIFEEDNQSVMGTARKKSSTGKPEKVEHRVPEVMKSRFDRQDILRNIAAAANYFGFSGNEDLQLARTQIAAILYMSGLSDADTIFEALNKDACRLGT